MILEFVICQGEYDFHESKAKLVIIWFLMDLDEEGQTNRLKRNCDQLNWSIANGGWFLDKERSF